MMRALVIYESMFGNTRAIAEAVAEGIGESMQVEVAEVGAVDPARVAEVDLLVVGAPSHAFGLSREQTRASAAHETDQSLVSTGIGLREWLEGLPAPTGHVAAAAFDTRPERPRLPGSAATTAQRWLRRLGFAQPVGAESFRVRGMTGPLLPGEIEYARHWGQHLGSIMLPVP